MSLSPMRKAVILSYGGLTVSILSGLIYTPWMIASIGTSDYAVFSLAMTIIGFFSIDFGLGPAVSKFLLDYNNKKDKKGYQQFLTTIYRIFWCISCIVALLFFLFYYEMDDFFVELTSDEIVRLKVVYLIAASFALLSMAYRPLDGILLANERFVFIKASELVHKVGTLITVVTLLLLDYGLYSLVFVNALTGGAKILAQFIYVRHHDLDASPFGAVNSAIIRQVFAFASWVTVAAIAQRFIILAAPMLLGALSGTTAVALFSVAMVIEAYSWMLSSALSGLFLPRISKTLAQKHDGSELLALLIKVGRLQLIIIGLVICGFTLLGKEFLSLWVGDDFLGVYLITLLLIAHGIVTLPQEIARTALFASGDVKYYAYSVLVVAFFSLLLSYFFIPMWGALGAALSIAIGQFIGNVVLINYFYIVILKIDMKQFFIQCHLKMLLPNIITLSLGVLFYYIPTPSHWGLFIIKGLLVSCVYLCSLWVLSFNDYEKKLFRQLFALIHPIKRRKRNVFE
jgi:O-antigen/teichoic acid export membrane protein